MSEYWLSSLDLMHVHQRHSVGTVLPQCCHSVATVLPQCCHSVATVLPQCCHSVATVLPQCCHSVATVLPQCCHSVGTVLAQCWHSVGTVLLLIKLSASSLLGSLIASFAWPWVDIVTYENVSCSVNSSSL